MALNTCIILYACWRREYDINTVTEMRGLLSTFVAFNVTKTKPMIIPVG